MDRASYRFTKYRHGCNPFVKIAVEKIRGKIESKQESKLTRFAILDIRDGAEEIRIQTTPSGDR